MKQLVNIPASIHDRLLNLSKAENKTFQEVLQYYCMERFLFRLSKTEFSQVFVLKGGLIFYALDVPLRRPTRDIDFRGFTKNSLDNIRKIIEAACSIIIPDDGLTFTTGSIQIDETMVDADYLGFRISFDAFLGPSKVSMRIDIGFSDVITPEPVTLRYPTLLEEMESPILKAYPLESIISEKFHAMVVKGDINSRFKDFYDIWMLSEINPFRGEVLKDAITATFDKRSTPIPSTIPLSLSEEFAISHQKQWLDFLRKNEVIDDRLQSFSEVVRRLRLFLWVLIQSIHDNSVFIMQWIPGEKWE